MQITFATSFLIISFCCAITLIDGKRYDTIQEALEAFKTSSSNSAPNVASDTIEGEPTEEETLAKLHELTDQMQLESNRIFGTSLSDICNQRGCNDKPISDRFPAHIPDFVYIWINKFLPQRLFWSDLKFRGLQFGQFSLEIEYYQLKVEANKNPTQKSVVDTHRFIIARLFRDFIRDLTIPIFPLELLHDCYELINKDNATNHADTIKQLQAHLHAHRESNKYEHDMFRYILRFSIAALAQPHNPSEPHNWIKEFVYLVFQRNWETPPPDNHLEHAEKVLTFFLHGSHSFTLFKVNAYQRFP